MVEGIWGYMKWNVDKTQLSHEIYISGYFIWRMVYPTNIFSITECASTL